MTIAAAMWIVVVAGGVALFLRLTRAPRPGDEERRPVSTVGPAAIGAIYDMLNEDKRKAVEIIVEGRAEATDPETKDGIVEDP
jgi:hypothetical protein